MTTDLVSRIAKVQSRLLNHVEFEEDAINWGGPTLHRPLDLSLSEIKQFVKDLDVLIDQYIRTTDDAR